MKKVYRVGCVGLLSDLPLFVAHAREMFLEEGVSVEITAELGWAGIEAKLSCGQLSAANMPAVMPLALSLRLGKIALPMRVLAATSFEGDAITLTPALADAFTDGRGGPTGPVHLGVEAPYTQAHLFLQTWLNRVHPDLRGRVIVVPLAVSQMADFFREGHVQGVCCSQPIGEIATDAGIGRTVARSRDYFPLHPHSALAASESFCVTEEIAALGLATAVRRARQYCAEPTNHAQVMRIFSQYKSSAFASSSLPGNVISDATALRTLIGFGPREVTNAPSGSDLIGLLAKACLALPGPRPADQELRNEAKRVFAALALETTAELRPP